jgi:hypothetical protein
MRQSYHAQRRDKRETSYLKSQVFFFTKLTKQQRCEGLILTPNNRTGIIAFLSWEEVITVSSTTTVTKRHAHSFSWLKIPALKITLTRTNLVLHHAYLWNKQMSTYVRYEFLMSDRNIWWYTGLWHFVVWQLVNNILDEKVPPFSGFEWTDM